MQRRVLSVAVAVWMFFSAGRAFADARAVVLIGGGAAFRDATSVALSAWDLRVVTPDTPPPRPVMPRAADEARALAQQWSASGVVWIAMDQNEPSLWVYDASTDQVVTRKIATAPPFDAPTAAAAALSVKTLLRASTVAPVEERIGAPTPPPKAVAPEMGQEQAPGVRPAEVNAAAAPAETILRAELEGGGRTIADKIDTRISAGASAWFGPRRNVGLAIVGSFGPGLSVSAARFAGRFNELAVAPSVRLRLPLGRRFVLEPRVGTSLHATTIDGVAVLTTRPASTSRVDGSLDAAVALDFSVSPTVGVALDLGASAMLRYQRYIAESDAIFELHPVQAFMGIRLTTGLL